MGEKPNETVVGGEIRRIISVKVSKTCNIHPVYLSAIHKEAIDNYVSQFFVSLRSSDSSLGERAKKDVSSVLRTGLDNAIAFLMRNNVCGECPGVCDECEKWWDPTRNEIEKAYATFLLTIDDGSYKSFLSEQKEAFLGTFFYRNNF